MRLHLCSFFFQCCHFPIIFDELFIELYSASLYVFLLPRETAPASIRRCSEITCTVAISPSEGASSRSRLWIYRPAPTTSSASPHPVPLSPPFPRHRIHASSPDHYHSTIKNNNNNNQSVSGVGIVRPDGGSSNSGGGVINVEDAFLNRSSVLFVAVSFILLMFISLAWLVFYYVQRFRYLHSKERASVSYIL